MLFYKKICPIGTSEYVILFGIRVFADVIKVRIYMRSTGLGWALNPMMKVLKMKEQSETQGEGHVNMEAEVGIMQPISQAKSGATRN